MSNSKTDPISIIACYLFSEMKAKAFFLAKIIVPFIGNFFDALKSSTYMLEGILKMKAY